jgi:hypothetical protein
VGGKAEVSVNVVSTWSDLMFRTTEGKSGSKRKPRKTRKARRKTVRRMREKRRPRLRLPNL